MGNNASVPVVSPPTPTRNQNDAEQASGTNCSANSPSTPGICPVSKQESSSGTCPISFFSKKKNPDVNKRVEGVLADNESLQPSSTCPVLHESSSSACPISEHDRQSFTDSKGSYKYPKVYNVYSQEIDPKNQMPANANQQAAPDQLMPLSTSRTKSSIPKGGTDTETWTYPSPQMFWNALVKKNKTEGAKEEDMDAIIAIHNNMNEMTWAQVLEWENLHKSESAGNSTEPKLLKFIGKPNDLSPKARLRVMLGNRAPFDRHDWTVDRGGKLIRYVIDYYHDESGVSRDLVPAHMHDATAMKSIVVEVRPALDSLDAVIDRVVLMPLAQYRGVTAYKAPSLFASKATKTAEQLKYMSIGEHWKNIEKQCAVCKESLALASSDEQRGAASVAMQVCVAGVVCPMEAEDFQRCAKLVKGKNPKEGELERVEIAYSSMVKCLELFEADSKSALGKQ